MTSPFTIRRLRSAVGTLLLAAILLGSFVPTGFAVEKDAPMPAKVMAAFIYKFISYIQWPEEAGTGEFKITVLGDSLLAGPLEEIAGRKTVAQKPIVFAHVEKLADLTPCDILVLSGHWSEQLAQVTDSLGDAPTLIVTHCPGCAGNGAGINFVTREGRIRFEVNVAALQRAQLVPAARFLKLAIIVDDEKSKEQP